MFRMIKKNNLNERHFSVYKLMNRLNNKNLGCKFIFTNLLIILSLSVSTTLFAQRTINLNGGNVVSTINSPQENIIPQDFLSQAQAARAFHINTTLQNANDVSIGDTVVLQLFESKNYISIVQNIKSDVNGNFTIMFKLPDYPMAFGYVTTNTKGRSLFSLTVPENNQRFSSRSSIASDADFLIELNDNDEIKLKDDQKEIPVKIPLNINNNNEQSIPQAPTDVCNPDPSLTGTDPETLNLLIVYTPAAQAWANANEGGISNTIAGAMAQAQAVLDNQGNRDTIVNVHSALVNYVEFLGDKMNTDLNRLTGTSDGYMDEVHQLRKQYYADIVSLFTDHNEPGTIGGLGWLLNNVIAGIPDYAFNVIRIQQASWTTTVIHEIGHNLGMNHEIQQYGATPPTPLFPYAWGWYWTGTNSNVYGSVMSYTGIETPYYSNPNIIYMGQPTGNAASANNAQVFRNTKHIVAFYKNRINNTPDAPANIVVSTPTPGGATISWDEVEGATSYEVWVAVPGQPGYYYIFSGITDIYFPFNYTGNFQACALNSFFVRAKNDCGNYADSPLYTFTTKCDTDPTVITQAATAVTSVSATLNKSVSANGNPVTSQGFKYKREKSSAWIQTTDGNLTGLTPNSKYKFYAYATTAAGTYNGNVLTFTTAPLAVDVYDTAGDGDNVSGFNAVGNWLLISAPFDNWTVGDFAFGGNPGAMVKTANFNSTNSFTWTNQIGNYSYQFEKGQGFAYTINPTDVANLTGWNGIKYFYYPIVTGNFNFPINTSNKYTLLGNPYLNDIDIDDLASTGVIKAGYYDFDVSGLGSTYQSYDGLIQPWKGFLAVNNSGASENFITFTEPIISSVPAFLKALPQRMTVTATNENGSFFTIIKRNQYSSASTIGNFDLNFINGNASVYPQIYSLKNNVKLGINAFGFSEEGVTIPLGILTNSSGVITLSFEGMDTYNCDITLIDYLTEAEIDLTALPSYDYQTDISSSSDSRFALYFGSRVPTSDNRLDNVNVQAFVRDGKINIVSSAELQNVKIYSVSGSQIADLNVSGKSYIINDILPSGVYLVKIQIANKISTQKIVLK